ncbi:MAG: efflux RND transporter periplasmic adaptor subunit [Deltaproteobacteria bacterium]|nr:MAG: efflux RND transporter periplasmic adaptor subunit [Deltaproteobacteria bacterium]
MHGRRGNPRCRPFFFVWFPMYRTLFLLVLVACGSSEPAKPEVSASAEPAISHWTCPMHPEVHEAGQTPCPKCKMDLVPVKAEAKGPADEVVHWTCPMHPSVKEAGQTPCPICRMDLTPVTRGELEGGSVVVDALRRQRFGVKTVPAEIRSLTRELRLPGAVKWDEDKIYDLSIRAEVWVEDLYEVESGQWVSEDQPLAKLYSPELYGAAREWLATKGTEREPTKLERLKLIGLSDKQIARIGYRKEASYSIDLPAPMDGVLIDFEAIEGDHLQRGATFGRIAKLDTVWVEAEVYEDEVALIPEGTPIVVHAPSGEPIHASVSRVEPWVDPKTRRATVRATVDNPDKRLLPDMYVDVVAKVDLGEKLAVPTEAIVVTGERRVVFVDAGEDRLVPRDIVVGRRAGDWTEVVSGLAPGDAVVHSGAFLVAAESRLRAAETYWGAAPSEEPAAPPHSMKAMDPGAPMAHEGMPMPAKSEASAHGH